MRSKPKATKGSNPAPKPPAAKRKGKGKATEPTQEHIIVEAPNVSFRNNEAKELYVKDRSRELIRECNVELTPTCQITIRKWDKVATHRVQPVISLIHEIYANAHGLLLSESEGRSKQYQTIPLRGESKLYLSPEAINEHLGITSHWGVAPSYHNMLDNIEEIDWEPIVKYLCLEGTQLIRNKEGRPLRVEYASLYWEAVWYYNFMCANIYPTSQKTKVTLNKLLFLYCLMKGRQIDIGRVIYDSIYGACKRSTTRHWPHPSLLQSMCDEAGVQVTEHELRDSVGHTMHATDLEGLPPPRITVSKKRKCPPSSSGPGESSRAGRRGEDPSCDPLSSFLAGLIKRSFQKMSGKLKKISRVQKAIQVEQKAIRLEQEFMRDRVEELARLGGAPPSRLLAPNPRIEEEESSSSDDNLE